MGFELAELDRLFYMDPHTGQARRITSFEEYFTLYEGPKPFRIEIIAGFIISTIFLSFDIMAGRGSRALTFETRVFKESDLGSPERPVYYFYAYTTPAQAWLGHEIAKQLAINGEFQEQVFPTY